MLTIYLIRHGETDFNKKGIVQGGGVDSDLNEFGKLQSQLFFNHYQHIPFQAIYASGLKRTIQTLEPWKALGHDIKKDRKLNELSWGVLEGIQPTAEQKSLFHETIAKWQEGNVDAKIDGGESEREVWERTILFLDSLYVQHPSGNILVCSHGRTIRVILRNLFDLDMEDSLISPLHNTSLTTLTYSEGNFQLDRSFLNDIHHLDKIHADSQ